MRNRIFAAAVFGIAVFFAVSCANEADIGDVLSDGAAGKVKRVQPESRGVRLTPSTALLYATETQAFTATLTGEGSQEDPVEEALGSEDDPLEVVDGATGDQGAAEYEWSITSKTDARGTSVSADGVVTLGENESGPVVVKAISKQNSSLWGTAVITIKSGKPPRPPEVYTVSFDITDGTSGKIDPVQVSEGDSVASVMGEDWIDPTNTNDAGSGSSFYLDSWNTNADGTGNPWAISDPVTSNLKVYAVWGVLAADKSVVRFDTNRQTVDAAPKTLMINKGSTLAAEGKTLPAPKSTASDFAGWYQDRDLMAISFTENSPVNDNEKTVYAKWISKRFKVEFDSNGGIDPQSELVDINTHLINLPVPIKGTSVFEGWYKDNGTFAEPWQNTDLVTSDIMLYAKWKDLYSYTVTFHSNGGSAVAPRTIESGSKLTSPSDPTKAGWTFGGWFIDDAVFANEWDFNTKITKDEDLYARWFDSNANLRKVIYNTNGAKEQISVRTAELGSLLTNPQDPEKEGFRFAGWYKDDENFTQQWHFSSDTLEGDIVLHAKWDPVIKYTVSFETNGGKPAIQERSVNDGDLLEFPVGIAKDGAVFAGWYSDSLLANAWDFKNDTVSKDTTLYAKWTHIVSFNSNGGTNVNSIPDVNSNARITEPASPTKTGADFYKWYKDAALKNEWNFSSNGDVVTENITLYAKWQHTVSFDSNGGGQIAAQTVFTGGKVTKPSTDPTKDKAKFDKWTKDASLTEEWDFAVDTVKAHTTIYGRWIQKNTIKFETNGATSGPIADKEITTGDKIPAVTQPVKTRYPTAADFGGWYSDEDLTVEWDFDSKVTGPMTLYVKWTHKVTFDTVGGFPAVSAKTIVDGRTLSAPSVSKEGAKLDGWYVPGAVPGASVKWNFQTDKVTSGTEVIPLVLSAKWDAENYLVRFAVDGGTEVVNQSVVYGGKATLPTTTKTGYKFIGWYEDASLSHAYSFDTLITKDAIIYAKWERLVYTVTFNSKGGSTVTEQKIGYNDFADEPTKPERAGYGFVAWHTVETNFTDTTRWSFSADPVIKNTALYAQWSTDTYTVHFDTDGGTEIKDLHPEHNTAITKPENPVKDGWNFVKWCVGDTATEWNFANKVTKDMTLTAKYTIKKYTVNFYRNHSDSDTTILVAKSNVEHDSFVTQDDPTRSGYKFVGWSTDRSGDSLLNLAGHQIKSNQIIYAIWDVIKYTVIFDVGIETDAYVNPYSVTQAFGSSVTLPTGEDVSRPGYTFAGWWTTAAYSGNALTSYTVPVNGATLYGKWNIAHYAITGAVTGPGSIKFLNSSGTVISTATYGTNVTVAIYPDATYQLKNGTLKYNGTAINLDHTQLDYLTGTFVMPAEAATVTAEFGAMEYAISANENITNGALKAYLVSDQTTEITSAPWGASVILKPEPVTGYKLKANTLTCVLSKTTTAVSLTSNAFTMPKSNVTINVVFENQTYTITKGTMTNGSVTVASTALYEASVTVTVSPATGYKLSSLTYTPQGGTATTLTASNNSASFAMPAANVTVNATFEKETYTITKGTVTGGSVSIENNATSAFYQASVTVTATHADGYKLKSITCTPTGGITTTLNMSNNSASFNMPASNVTIAAVFETLPANLAIKFGIISSGNPTTTAQVTDTFNAVHNYISESGQFSKTTTNTGSSSSDIRLGDYIDLPSLAVESDAEEEYQRKTPERYGKINATNVRLVVVGINSFNGINGNDKPHIVFHFSSPPGKHPMNSSYDEIGPGYFNIKMRTYVINKFLPGLISAGVPDSVLWAPSRRVASDNTSSTTAQTITDKLWVPTEWEIFGSRRNAASAIETASNQANFTEYYKNANMRATDTSGYWLASPAPSSKTNKVTWSHCFCYVTYSGNISDTYDSSTFGCAPAFCVQ